MVEVPSWRSGDVDAAPVDEAQLAAWGREFARSLPRPAVIALQGELGAGKTTLARAICAELGVTEKVTSPTFALVHRYAANGSLVYHVDAYRLKPDDNARDLGFDEMLADRGAVVLVEWPERLGSHAPPFTHRIALSYSDDGARRHIELK
jgi:tRNA threonylcarbamoyladenosine biosynthesis protein TsaE